MFKQLITSASICIMIVSCHNASSDQAGGKTGAMDSHDSTAPTQGTASLIRADLKGLSFDSKKDLACGMPISAGLQDTAHYNGKLYGFCSKECKDEFLKDPASLVAKNK